MSAKRIARVSQEKVFELVEYEPHRVQVEFHRAPERFKVACMGRRTGKSKMGGNHLLLEAFNAKFREGLSKTGRRSEFWIVGPEYSDAEKEFRVLYDGLTKLGAPLDKPGTYYSPEAGQMDLSMYEGKFQVHAKSAKYPNTLVGESLEGVIMAEAAKLKPVVWTKFIRPMLADYRGWADITSTPEGKNWFYDMFRRGQDPLDKQWWSMRAPSWSNNVLFPLGMEDPEIHEMRKDMSEEKFKQEIGAEFTEFVGRVFKNFDEEINVIDIDYDPNKPLYVATDYGYTNPNVMLFIQVGVWDDVYVIGEYYRRNRTPEEFARDIAEHPVLGPLSKRATDLYPDPEDPGASNTLAEKFRWNIHRGTGGPVQNRLDLIRKWLTPQPLELEDGHPDKLPKLWIDRSCTYLAREMQDYRYPESKSEVSESKENPLKVDDHAPEALGRFFGGYYGAKHIPKRRSRQTTARLSS